MNSSGSEKQLDGMRWQADPLADDTVSTPQRHDFKTAAGWRSGRAA
jgi:hypothetical protein